MLNVCPTLAFSHVSLSRESKRQHKNTNYTAIPNNIKMDGEALKQVSKFKYLGSIFTEDGKNKEDTIQRIKEAKVMFNSKKQILCSKNLSLEMTKKLIKSCIWSVVLYGSETWTVGKNEERVVNAFETWCWRRMLKI